MSAFNRMNKSDQEEFLTLYNKFENLKSLPPSKMEFQNRVKGYFYSMEQNKEKAEKMFKILNIYVTNMYSLTGVYLKISRINHSCRANAVFGKGEIRAVYKIEEGQEINLDYAMVIIFRLRNFVIEVVACQLPSRRHLLQTYFRSNNIYG